MPTALRDLIDHLVDGHLDTIVATRRADGVAWRDIAAELTTKSGRPVSHTSLRDWYAEVGPRDSAPATTNAFAATAIHSPAGRDQLACPPR